MQMSDFDPYDHLIKMTELLNDLLDAHNKLSHHYEKQMKRVALLEKRIDELETDILLDRIERPKQ